MIPFIAAQKTAIRIIKKNAEGFGKLDYQDGLTRTAGKKKKIRVVTSLGTGGGPAKIARQPRPGGKIGTPTRGAGRKKRKGTGGRRTKGAKPSQMRSKLKLSRLQGGP